jgi:thymidylate synthase (FAD)
MVEKSTIKGESFMKFNEYKDTLVEMLWATPNPMRIVSTALKVTMKQDFMHGKVLGSKVIPEVLAMGHTSVFEHVVYSFAILGASRSFLAQITRHRMASFTSGSQHYQNYSDYGSRGHGDLTEEPVYQRAIENSMDGYNELVELGYAPYEARQVLPNAMENNLIFTVNARSLINFLSLRVCRRNTAEIADVARKIHLIAIEHFPELFSHVGAPCVMAKNTAMSQYPELIYGNPPATRFCNQGKMSACRK